MNIFQLRKKNTTDEKIKQQQQPFKTKTKEITRRDGINSNNRYEQKDEIHQMEKRKIPIVL